MPGVKAPAHAHHHSRLGMALALLALLAQLWLGQVSTAHMAQMLVPAAMAADICTAQESPSLSASTSASTQAPGHGTADALMNCPVCAVATTVAAADLWPHGSTAHPPQAADSFSNQPVAPRALRHASLYPPAQAPPRG